MKINLAKAFDKLVDEVVDFLQNLARDVRSLRSLLCWVYCFLYIWVVVYGVTHYKECINTAIISTSTLVGAIFTGYVFSKSYEKVSLKEQDGTANKPDPNENGASA